MIQITDLYKKFGKLQVLRALTLIIPSGGVTAILGPNASGKTTLIKSILGLVRPDSGTITIDGKDVLGGTAYRRDIGYMPQIARFPGKPDRGGSVENDKIAARGTFGAG